MDAPFRYRDIMQAIQIREFGTPDGLEVVDIPEPSPTPGQLVVEVEAIGVGGVDAVIRRGTLGSYGFQPGLIPGSEVAGIVVAVGEGVDDSWLGRRVWAFTGVSGGYTELAVAASVNDVTPIPQRLSSVDAVTLGSAGPVAHFGLHHGRLVRGETVLVRGASGSLGIMAVQLAAAAGAREIAVTVSSVARGKALRELGATITLDRDGNGEPSSDFDVIFDVVGGPGLPAFIDRLAPNGRYVSVGVVAGNPPADFGMRLQAAFQKSLSYSTFSLNTVPIPERNRVRAEIFEQAAHGAVRAVLQEVLPLAQAAEAHRRMDAGEVFGRIVLRP